MVLTDMNPTWKIIIASVANSGATTNVVGDTSLTAAWTANSCVLTFEGFVSAPKIFVTQMSGVTGAFAMTGVTKASAGIVLGVTAPIDVMIVGRAIL